nr:DUF4920 domain-containing protein [Polyangiaceae bacterium]
AVGLAACQKELPYEKPAQPEAVPSAAIDNGAPTKTVAKTDETHSAPPPVQGQTKLGAPIASGSETQLAALAKAPATFKGKIVTTSGTIRKMCQHQGCWLELTDGTISATVRTHAHSFLIPLNSAGRKARVQGNVMLTKDGKECDDIGAVGAALEFDATGIELM